MVNELFRVDVMPETGFEQGLEQQAHRVLFAMARMRYASPIDLAVSKDILAAKLSETEVRNILQSLEDKKVVQEDSTGTFKITEKGLHLAKFLTHGART